MRFGAVLRKLLKAAHPRISSDQMWVEAMAESTSANLRHFGVLRAVSAGDLISVARYSAQERREALDTAVVAQDRREALANAAQFRGDDEDDA